MSRILVVDDDPVFLLSAEAVLEAANHQVHTVGNPRGVRTLLANERFDAMTLDIVMPGLSGFELLEMLRREPATARMPVVLVSSRADRSDRVEALRKGADDFLTKPFDPEELLLRIERLIAASGPPFRGFGGDLASYPCCDLLQGLVKTGKSGRLLFTHRDNMGEVRILAGEMVSASYGGILGEEAVLALLELQEGSFSYQETTPDEPKITGRPLSLQHLLMHFAWLEDEVARLQHWAPMPGDTIRWAAPLTQQPETGEPMPFAPVLDALGQADGMDLEELSVAAGVAPITARSTVAYLAQVGCVSFEAAGLDTEALQSVSEIQAKLDLVLDQLLEASQAAGKASATQHVVLLAQDTVWDDLCRLVGGVPGGYADGGWGRLCGRLAGRQGGRCTVPRESGNLALHVLPLRRETRRLTEAVLPMCAAVAIWTGQDDEDQELSGFLGRLRDSPAKPRKGMLISHDIRLADLVPNDGCWRILARQPRDLAGALALLI